MSASSMWVANAATISPSLDTTDKRVHLTVANLANALHRSMEVPQTTRVLNTIFEDKAHFVVHSAITSHSVIGDEGAANHGRLCLRHDQPGVEVFVYGKSAFLEKRKGFPCRQAVEASKAVARNHGLSYENSIFLQQSEEAVDAGVFHNDVISVINENVFLMHEKSFINQVEEINVIRRKCNFDVCFLNISEDELPLHEAVSSYFFNSQLITLPDGAMMLLMPKEVEENVKALNCVDRLIADTNNPINDRVFLNLKQSMKNGGGPACLRLRVLLNQSQIDALGGDVMMTESKLDELERIVKAYYREKITPDDLFDAEFIKDSYCALREIAKCLSMREIYDFSK
ncbi:Succinylarginine dihydrolase [gamma proteobacterium IMCC1989]|nr:Succinylarginine dihydrolase [gamma proteobacterium IMCC1989]